MLSMQPVAERHELLPKALRRIVAMVQVNLDLPEPPAAEVRQNVDTPRVVFLFRVEASVARRPTIGIAEPASRLRIAPTPLVHVLPCLGGRHPAAAKGLKVVGDTENQPTRPRRPPSAQHRQQVPHQPFVSGAEHPRQALFRVGAHVPVACPRRNPHHAFRTETLIMTTVAGNLWIIGIRLLRPIPVVPIA